MEALRVKRLKLESEITKLRKAEFSPVVQCLFTIVPNLDVLEIVTDYGTLCVCEGCWTHGIWGLRCLNCAEKCKKKCIEFNGGLFLEDRSMFENACDFLRNIRCRDENEQEILDYILDHVNFNQVFLGDNIIDGWNDFLVVVRFQLSQYIPHYSGLIEFQIK